jgi:hypothetical protein
LSAKSLDWALSEAEQRFPDPFMNRNVLQSLECERSCEHARANVAHSWMFRIMEISELIGLIESGSGTVVGVAEVTDCVASLTREARRNASG